MTISNTKSLAQIVANPNSRLGRLVNRAQQLTRLSTLFRQVVTDELGLHCQVGNYDEATLSLIVDSSAWATRLRFAIPDLLKALKIHPEFKTLSKIRYRIVAH